MIVHDMYEYWFYGVKLKETTSISLRAIHQERRDSVGEGVLETLTPISVSIGILKSNLDTRNTDEGV